MILFEFKDVQFQKDSNRLQQLWSFIKFLFQKETKGKELLVLAFKKGDQDALFSHERYFVTGIDDTEAEQFMQNVPEAAAYFDKLREE